MRRWTLRVTCWCARASPTPTGSACWPIARPPTRSAGISREAVVSVVSDWLLFGDAHPYGRPVEGYTRTLERLTLDHVRAFHQSHWRPNHAFLVVAGAFDEASLRARLEAAFGDWTGSPPPEAAPPPAWPARPRLCIVD